MSLLEFSLQTCQCGKETTLDRFTLCDACKSFWCPGCMAEARAAHGGEDVNGTGVNLCPDCTSSGKGLPLLFPEAHVHKTRFYTVKVGVPGDTVPFAGEFPIRSDHLLTGLFAMEADLQVCLAHRGYFNEKIVDIQVYCGRRLVEQRFDKICNLGYAVAMAIEHDLRKWPLLLGV